MARPALILASACLVGIGLVVLPALADKPAEVLSGPLATKVSAIPIAFDRDRPERTAFGNLTFRGGLNLFGKSRHFGGYSGIALDPSGTTLLAVSDAGTWMRATLDYDGRKLKALDDVVIGPILGKDGRPLRGDSERDSEGLALASGDPKSGAAFVSFERDHRILRYPFTMKSFGPPDRAVPLPKEAGRMDRNRGIEAIALVRSGRLAGTLVAFSEGLTDKNGNLQGWFLGGSTPGVITVRRLGGFDITDAASLPDGGLVLLERRFRYSEGVKMRIRRIAASELKRGALIEGEVLLEAEDNLNIDNMEAIAVHRAASGETILTLMADDNFSALQRTLIMQFSLPDGPVLAAPGAQ
ncbi:MAG: esterase-like activity of phytase family protein [Methyloceanibacter sp.]|uniref:esterase-like activity of phytase family protein n=1 Tax=Methyloceanibacter sp. TaxID=1965321 RepID=UPI003D6D1B60